MIAFLVAALVSGAATAHAEDSACYGGATQSRTEQAEMMRQMRDMRPQADAAVKRVHQQQAERAVSDYQARAQQMVAPYISRGTSIISAGRGCADPSCASAISAQAQSFVADVTSTLLPQLYSLASQARSEMLNTQQMSLDRVESVFRKQTGMSLPSSRGSIHYLPICRQFRPLASIHQVPMAPWSAKPPARSPSPPPANRTELKSWIRELNEKQAKGLGENVCTGSLAMGTVRCFKREEDPQGYGRICEKAPGGSLIGCYDASAAWTPPSYARSEGSLSWLDRAPPAMKLLAGGIPIEDLKAKDGPMERAEKTIGEMKLVAPVLRPDATGDVSPAGKVQKVEPPVPFAVLEEKIRNGKGLTQAELLQMSDSDRLQFQQLMGDLQKESATPDSVRAAKEAAVAAGAGLQAGYDSASAWTASNKEHIESTIEMLEAESLVFGPVASGVAKGLEGVVLTAQVGTKILAMHGEGRDNQEIAMGVAGVLGAEGLKKLGEKGLAATFLKNGFSHEQAEQLSEQTVRYGDALKKRLEHKNGAHE